MNGKFVTSQEAVRDQLDWGTMGWFSRPELTATKHLVIIEVDLQPGFGHDFHKHPEQEESIYVLSGKIEQWLEKEKQILNPGDAIYIGADVVHASFNTFDEPAKLLVALGPAIGEEGYQLVEVHEEEPWSQLRK